MAAKLYRIQNSNFWLQRADWVEAVVSRKWLDEAHRMPSWFLCQQNFGERITPTDKERAKRVETAKPPPA